MNRQQDIAEAERIVARGIERQRVARNGGGIWGAVVAIAVFFAIVWVCDTAGIEMGLWISIGTVALSLGAGAAVAGWISNRVLNR